MYSRIMRKLVKMVLPEFKLTEAECEAQFAVLGLLGRLGTKEENRIFNEVHKRKELHDQREEAILKFLKVR